MLFSPDTGFEVEIRGEEYLILRERDVHADRVDPRRRPVGPLPLAALAPIELAMLVLAVARTRCRGGGAGRARRRRPGSARPRSRRRCPSPVGARRPASPAASMPGRDRRAGGDDRARGDERAARRSCAPSSTTDPLATMHSSPSSAPCTTQLCATVTPAPDVGREPGRSVDHRVVLHVGAPPHDHRRVVGADDHAVPDRRAFLDDHVADQRRGRRDERRRVDAAASDLRTRTAASGRTSGAARSQERACDARARRSRPAPSARSDRRVGERRAGARTPGSTRRPDPVMRSAASAGPDASTPRPTAA